MSTSHIADRIARGEREHGTKWDPSDLLSAPAFHQHLNSDDRIKVLTHYGETITGRVSTTGGWRPAFMLVRRSNAMGSSDLLDARDVIVGVQRAGTRGYY